MQRRWILLSASAKQQSLQASGPPRRKQGIIIFFFACSPYPSSVSRCIQTSPQSSRPYVRLPQISLAKRNVGPSALPTVDGGTPQLEFPFHQRPSPAIMTFYGNPKNVMIRALTSGTRLPIFHLYSFPSGAVKLLSLHFESIHTHCIMGRAGGSYLPKAPQKPVIVKY